MEKIKILIVEDTKAESDRLIETFSTTDFEIVGIARSHQEALQLFFANTVDICVVDIFLNGIPEGITFAESLNNIPNAARPFIFLTSSNDRTIFERAKLAKPFSFLLKPFNPLEVVYALEMALEKFYDQPDALQDEEENTIIGTDFLFIKKKDSLKKVNLADIINIEVEERYCTIHTQTNKFVIQISLSKIIELLNPKLFIRVHRSHLVNVNSISEILQNDEVLVLDNGTHIPYGEKYKEVLSQFNILK